MSEYQYYDFRSIDKVLTAQQKQAMYDLSSRAVVSSRHAQFVYNYGDFHGNPIKVMADHFDIMLYVANWGTQRLMFRIPEIFINLDALKDYFILDELEHHKANKNIILDLCFNDDEGGGGDWIDGEGLLDDFLSLREELIQGDYRVLYLAWLKSAENAMTYDRIDKQTKEPKVPAGLNQLSMAQKAYAKWIELDPSLIKVAAENTKDYAQATFQPQDCLHYLSTSEKDNFLQRLCKNEANLSATLNRKLQTVQQTIQQTKNKQDATEESQSRTFFDLYQRYQQVANQEEKRQGEKERLEEEQQQHLKLAQTKQREPLLWETIYTLVERGNAKSYDSATEYLSDLYDLAQHENKEAVFIGKVKKLTTQYSRRVAFIRRVRTVVQW